MAAGGFDLSFDEDDQEDEELPSWIPAENFIEDRLNNWDWRSNAKYGNQLPEKNKKPGGDRDREEQCKSSSSSDGECRRRTPLTMSRTKFTSQTPLSERIELECLKQWINFSDYDERSVGSDSQGRTMAANNQRQPTESRKPFSFLQQQVGSRRGANGCDGKESQEDHALDVERFRSSSAEPDPSSSPQPNHLHSSEMEHSLSSEAEIESNHRERFYSNQVMSSLMQVRSYISKAISVRDNLLEKKECSTKVTRLSRLIKHLKEEERVYMKFLQRMVKNEEQEQYFASKKSLVSARAGSCLLQPEAARPLQHNLREEMRNLKKERELLRKLLMQQEQLKALEDRQALLLSLQQTAEQSMVDMDDLLLTDANDSVSGRSLTSELHEELSEMMQKFNNKHPDAKSFPNNQRPAGPSSPNREAQKRLREQNDGTPASSERSRLTRKIDKLQEKKQRMDEPMQDLRRLRNQEIDNRSARAVLRFDDLEKVQARLPLPRQASAPVDRATRQPRLARLSSCSAFSATPPRETSQGRRSPGGGVYKHGTPYPRSYGGRHNSDDHDGSEQEGLDHQKIEQLNGLREQLGKLQESLSSFYAQTSDVCKSVNDLNCEDYEGNVEQPDQEKAFLMELQQERIQIMKKLRVLETEHQQGMMNNQPREQMEWSMNSQDSVTTPTQLFGNECQAVASVQRHKPHGRTKAPVVHPDVVQTLAALHFDEDKDQDEEDEKQASLCLWHQNEPSSKAMVVEEHKDLWRGRTACGEQYNNVNDGDHNVYEQDREDFSDLHDLAIEQHRLLLVQQRLENIGKKCTRLQGLPGHEGDEMSQSFPNAASTPTVRKKGGNGVCQKSQSGGFTFPSSNVQQQLWSKIRRHQVLREELRLKRKHLEALMAQSGNSLNLTANCVETERQASIPYSHTERTMATWGGSTQLFLDDEESEQEGLRSFVLEDATRQGDKDDDDDDVDDDDDYEEEEQEDLEQEDEGEIENEEDCGGNQEIGVDKKPLDIYAADVDCSKRQTPRRSNMSRRRWDKSLTPEDALKSGEGPFVLRQENVVQGRNGQSPQRIRRQENSCWVSELSFNEKQQQWQMQLDQLKSRLEYNTAMCNTLLQDQQSFLSRSLPGHMENKQTMLMFQHLNFCISQLLVQQNDMQRQIQMLNNQWKQQQGPRIFGVDPQLQPFSNLQGIPQKMPNTDVPMPSESMSFVKSLETTEAAIQQEFRSQRSSTSKLTEKAFEMHGDVTYPVNKSTNRVYKTDGKKSQSSKQCLTSGVQGEASVTNSSQFSELRSPSSVTAVHQGKRSKAFSSQVNREDKNKVKNKNYNQSRKDSSGTDIDIPERISRSQSQPVGGARPKDHSRDKTNNELNIPPNNVPSEASSELSLFEALRGTIYSEVAALISQNEAHPHFLLELFHKLQMLNSEELRQSVLRSLKDTVVKCCSESHINAEKYQSILVPDSCAPSSLEPTPIDSVTSSDDEDMEHVYGNRAIVCKRKMAVKAAPVDSAELLPSSPETLISEGIDNTVIHLNQTLTGLCKVKSSNGEDNDKSISDDGAVGGKAVKSSDVDTLCTRDWIKSIIAQVIPQLMWHKDELCSTQLLSELQQHLLSLTWQHDESNHIGKQLASALQETLNKFLGLRLKDCVEYLLVEVSEMLFNELDFLHRVQSVMRLDMCHESTPTDVPSPRAHLPFNQEQNQLPSLHESEHSEAVYIGKDVEDLMDSYIALDIALEERLGMPQQQEHKLGNISDAQSNKMETELIQFYSCGDKTDGSTPSKEESVVNNLEAPLQPTVAPAARLSDGTLNNTKKVTEEELSDHRADGACSISLERVKEFQNVKVELEDVLDSPRQSSPDTDSPISVIVSSGSRRSEEEDFVKVDDIPPRLKVLCEKELKKSVADGKEEESARTAGSGAF
uniref:pericentriolar material 1 protein isoform X4 n=1 Tax=Myxine glutinosa TaxID=7769 RepID=UPI00358E9027